ncbi:MAG: hypothetical protein ACI33S_00345 [Bacilli bacterium]
MNKMFLINLNDFQNKAIEVLLENKNKRIFIKSKKFTGKTMLAKKIFENTNNTTIYHTGSSPKLFERAKNDFINILNNIKENEITIILDEFYDDEIINIVNKKNYTVYILTNDLSLKNKEYMTFNYYEFYNRFINNECGKYLNLHEVLNKDINFSKNNEILRKSSKSTITYVKKNNLIKEYRLEE